MAPDSATVGPIQEFTCRVGAEKIFLWKNIHTTQIQAVGVPAGLNRWFGVCQPLCVQSTGFVEEFESLVVEMHKRSPQAVGQVAAALAVPVVPHERRSATYTMGLEDKDEINDPIEIFVPDFFTEESLSSALDIVYKRFLTEYGGQRFEDPAPDLAPDILATAKEWADWKDAGITVEEVDEDNNGILIFIPESGSAGIGSELEICEDRSTSQNLLETKSGTLNAVPGYLPPFFTAPELRGALEAAYDVLKQR
jgi:hypothetical protein